MSKQPLSPLPQKTPPAAASSAKEKSVRKVVPEPESSNQLKLRDGYHMALRSISRLYSRSFDRRPYLTITVTNSVLNGLGDACAQLLPAVITGDTSSIQWDRYRTFRFMFFGASMGPLVAQWNIFLERTFPLRPGAVNKLHPSPLATSGTTKTGKVKSDDDVLPDRSGYKVDEKVGPRVMKAKDIRGAQAALGAALGKGGGVKEEKAADRKKTEDRAESQKAGGGGGQEPVDWFMVFKRVACDQLIMAPMGLAIFIISMGLMEGMDWDEIISERLSKMWLPLLLVNWQIWPTIQLINFRFIPLQYRVPFGAACGVLWTVYVSYTTAKTVQGQEGQVKSA